MNRESNHATKNNKRYHHGDLRDALIIAAAQLIEERGAVGFAMIDAARRAGVSSAAPYRHFKDKDALLKGVGELAFLALAESTRNIAAEVPMGTEQGITAICEAYFNFVTGHPQFYDLMWGHKGLRAIDSSDAEMKKAGFYILVDSVSRWCDTLALDNCDARELSVNLLAMAHGLACIAMTQQLDKFFPEGGAYSLLETGTRTFLEGLRGQIQPAKNTH